MRAVNTLKFRMKSGKMRHLLSAWHRVASIRVILIVLCPRAFLHDLGVDSHRDQDGGFAVVQIREA